MTPYISVDGSVLEKCCLCFHDLRDVRQCNLVEIISSLVDWDSSVGIATYDELDGLRIESWWERVFPYPSRPTLEPTQSSLQWLTGLFRGGKAAGPWC
jgi:hypothetical protein